MLGLARPAPVTVPSERVLPPMEGCSARSAATAEVIMLLGPPTRMPMTPSMKRRRMGFITSEYMANIHRSGARMHLRVGGWVVSGRVVSGRVGEWLGLSLGWAWGKGQVWVWGLGQGLGLGVGRT